VNEIVESDQAEIVSHAADMVEANQSYGALSEGLYLAGFTFERAMARVLGLLKTGGWMKVGAGFDDVNAFVRGLPLDQFKIVTEQRKEFVERVRALQPAVSNRAIAGALGVDRRTIDRDRGANAPPGAQNGQQNGEPSGANAPPGARDGRRDARIIIQRDHRRERVAEKLASMGEAARLEGKFSVLVSDPPLRDEFGPNPRQTERHYPTMTEAELVAMADEIKRITAEHAVHYMWISPHMLPIGFRILDAWGFEFRLSIVWPKETFGLGHWARHEHEELLIGRKGAFPPPPESLRVSSMLRAPRGRHSEKPEIILELIEQWYPAAPKIELFRRGPPRPGWAAWGNEVSPELAAE
jgi:N6-adenosine-specific RNA methylase IME4